MQFILCCMPLKFKDMKIYYREFEDLTDLNEWVKEAVEKENVIIINYVGCKHCMYFWM